MRKRVPHWSHLSGDTQSVWKQQNARGIGYVAVTSSQTRSVYHPRYWQSTDIRFLKDLTTSESHHWLHQTQQTKSLRKQEHSHHKILLRISSSFVATGEVLSTSKHHLPLSTHISPVFCRRGKPMEVIEDCTVFFFGILPHTLLPTGKSISPSSPFSTTKFSQKKGGCT